MYRILIVDDEEKIRTHLVETTNLKPHKLHIQAIKYAISSGVKGIFTVHGSSIEELKLNTGLSELLQKFIIEKIIFLSETVKGQAKEIFELDKFERKYTKKRIKDSS